MPSPWPPRPAPRKAKMAEAWRLASPAPPSRPQPPHATGQQAFTAITRSPDHGTWPDQGLAQENRAQHSARGGPSTCVLTKALLSPWTSVYPSV